MVLVNDIQVTGPNDKAISRLFKELSMNFQLESSRRTDLGECEWY